MVAYQLNDGTRVDAKSPSADRKLSWNAAIFFSAFIVRRGGCGSGGGGGGGGGGNDTHHG